MNPIIFSEDDFSKIFKKEVPIDRQCNTCGITKNVIDYFEGGRCKCNSCRNKERRAPKITKAEITKGLKVIHQSPFEKLTPFSENIPKNNIKYMDRIKIFDEDISEKFEPDAKDFTFMFLSFINFGYRVQDVPSWCSIGKIFCNTFDGTEVGLEYWLRITLIIEEEIEDLEGIKIFDKSSGETIQKRSKLCKKLYNEYKSIQKNKLTYKTLAFFAMEDNKAAYDKWKLKWIDIAVSKAFSLIHGDVAVLVHRMTWLDYINVDNDLFHFNLTKFESSSGNDFITDIDDKIIPYLEKLSVEFLTKKDTKKDDASFTKLINKLKDVRYLKFIIERLKTSHFKKVSPKHIKMDSNNNLLCLKNCVIEKCLGKVYIRSCKPEDFITKECNIEYDVSLNENDKNVIFVRNWIKQMFVEPDSIKQVLQLISSCLFAQEGNKVLPFFVGEPNCGKSLFCQLIAAVLGDYATTLSSIVLNATNSTPGAPNPELANVEDMRFICIPETNAMRIICCQLFKLLSGGDPVSTRKLYQNGKPFMQTGMTVACMNHIPNFDIIDEGVKERLNIIKFIGRYINDAPESEDEQIKTNTYKRDKDFPQKVERYAPAFLWILVKFYQEHGNEMYTRSKSDIELCDAFYKSQNIYHKFSTEIIGSHPDRKNSNSYLTSNDLYKIFKTWFSSRGYNSIPNKDIFDIGMDEVLGPRAPPNKNSWRGHFTKINLENMKFN